MDIWSEIKNTFKQGSVLSKLIYINLAVFLIIRITYVFFYLFRVDFNLLEWLALPSDVHQLATRPWTIITYMFLHFDFLHIFLNLLWLYWFGKIFLMYFDERKLLGTYLFGGLFGGLFYMLAYNLFPAFAAVAQQGMLLGASASIIAIVIAAAIYAPNLSVNLLLISSIFGPIKIIWIALFSLLIYFISITGTNPGGNIAHLGGAFWGFVYMLQLKKNRDILGWFNNFLFKAGSIFHRKQKMRVSYRNNPTHRMTDWEYNKTKKAEKENINEILDKIGKSGYDSLSKHEKEVLFKMGSKKGKPN
ncbi:MAG TPA: rhomboid family intramembrane serine protease [Prolixibacteraceae bacterium]|nr:rhomboid family intramembrane serine protease [Prolixibacteraceae bacterium]